MSAIDFSKYPPKSDNVVPIRPFDGGQWVRDQFTAAFGVIQSRDAAGVCRIVWSNGLESAEYDTALVETNPQEFLSYLRTIALNDLGWTDKTFNSHVPAELTLEALSAFETSLLSQAPAHDDGAWATVEETAQQLDAAAPGAEIEDIFAGFCDEGESVSPASPADSMPADVAERLCPGITDSANNMCVLCGKVKTNRTSPTLDDGRRICKRCQVTGTIVSETVGEEVIDFFPGAADPKPVDVVVNPVSTAVEDTAETATGTCEKSGADSEKALFSLPRLCSIIPDPTYLQIASLSDFELDGKKNDFLSLLGLPVGYFLAVYDHVVNLLTEEIECGADISPAEQTQISKRVAVWHLNQLYGKRIEASFDPPKFVNQSGTVVDATDTQNAASTTAQAAQIAEELVQEIIAGSATKEDGTQPVSAVTDAGLIDPETGEVLEPSFILRKLGWTELPVLSKNPTHQELDAFEDKLDQILDRVSSHQDKTARYRAACEKRCAPYDSAAKFWDEQFIKPMSKMLAPFKLKQNSKGEYKSKTMVLPSGCIKFTKSGGAFVHDEKLVKAYIQEHGVENFASIGAKMEAVYSYRKLVAALAKGTLKDIPGTGIRETNHFATAKVVSPAASGNTAEQEGEEDGD